MTENKLPEIDRNVAHPQAVWFNEHWRPAFEQLQKENEELKAELAYYKNGRQIKEVHYDEPTPHIAEITALQSKLKIVVDALDSCVKSWGDYVPSPQSKAAKALKDAKSALSEIREI